MTLAHAASNAVVPPGSPQFLQLPFNDPAVRVNQGWYYLKRSRAKSLACAFPGGDLSGYRRHCGIDFRKKPGKRNQTFQVLAAAGGRVIKTRGRDTGTMVMIEHDGIRAPGGQTYCTRYLHLNPSRVQVKSGDIVTAGQPIAWAGRSGTRTIHLHFDVKVGGCHGNQPRVDPYDIAGSMIRSRIPPVMDFYPTHPKYKGCGPNALLKSCGQAQ